MEKYPNINILINVPRTYLPKAEFVLRTYCYILRLNPKFYYGQHTEGIHIYYGVYNNHNYPVRIYYQSETAEFYEGLELYPLELVNFRKYNKEFIPFLFSQNGEIYTFYEDFCAVRKDIVASGFYFLSCWPEYILSSRGIPRGRVDFRHSLQYRWDFTEVPVVDIYCRILFKVISILLPEYVRDILWNEKKDFALSLSHDVDYWHYWTPDHMLKTYQYNLATSYRRPLNALYKLVGHTLSKAFYNDPWRKIRYIIRKEEARNVQSTWFLMAKDDYEDSRQNYISNPAYKEQVLDLLGQKDIGLHGSPESAFDLEVLTRELKVLKDMGLNPAGFRTHYLHFDYQKSFSMLEQAGVKYDSTLGFWEHIGYRAGISFPFFPFNLKENRPFRVLEIPLIVMDTTLLSVKGMNLNAFSAFLRLSGMLARSANYQSHLSLLWHNTTFDFIDFPFWGNLYWKMIGKARNKNAWITNLTQIYEEWVNLSY
jgi:hypothetical protein